MPVQPAGDGVKATIRRILERFLSTDEHWHGPQFGPLFSAACDRFRLNCLESKAFDARLTEHPFLELRDKDHYFVLEPPEDERFLPFVTLHGNADWAPFRVYVLLASFDKDSEIQGVAFRYETDEGDGNGKHDFCHAQICRSIKPGGNVVTPFWMLESDPAMPLDADNQMGLVLCMLTSIYGRRNVLKKFDRTDGEVWEQMRTIRALRRI